MAAQFSSQALDTLLAPGISSFDEAHVPALTGMSDQADHWVSNFFLNSLFGARYDEKGTQAALTFIFRTQNARRAYLLAREKTLECVEAFQPGRPASRLYFEAVSHWETTLLNVQIVLDLFKRYFSPGQPEPSEGTKIRLAANRIKHYAEDILDGSSAGLTLPLWLSKDRLRTSAADVTFEELAQTIVEMGKAADILERPGGP